MEPMVIRAVIQKLVGNIDPVADSAIDAERLENLKTLCKVLFEFVVDIDRIGNMSRNSPYASEKEIGQFANKFIVETLEIHEKND